MPDPPIKKYEFLHPKLLISKIVNELNATPIYTAELTIELAVLLLSYGNKSATSE